jgi:TM2 domain-containing membrane protein YozV
MTARTFGKKGIGEGVAAPRRAAFLGQQRTSAERAVDSEVFPAPEQPALAVEPESAAPIKPAPAIEPVATDRSLKTAYTLWFCLGLAGGHRFYLRRPLTGALQAIVFLGCWGAALMEYYWAFAGLALSCLWMIADGFLIRRMHRTSGAS